MANKLLAALAFLLLLAGCASVPFENGGGAFDAAPEDEKAAFIEKVRAEQQANSEKTFRYSADLTIKTAEEGTTKITAMALWRPGENVRWRLSYLGYTFFSALGDRKEWLLFLEDAGIVYRCPAASLPYVKAPKIPPLAWKVLSHSLDGFRPTEQNLKNIENCPKGLKVTTEDGAFLYTSNLLPEYGEWRAISGETCQAYFKGLQEIQSLNAFLANTNAYKVMILR